MRSVILGLLLIRPLSLYDLVQAFGQGVALLYSASTGSIKRALDGLRADGLVEVDSVEPTGRRRTAFRITDAGRDAFHDWMTGEIVGPDAEDAALPRLFFLGHLDAAERDSVVDRIRARIAHDLAGLEQVAAATEGVEAPDEHRDLAASQRATLDYGIASHRFALDWFERYAAGRA